MLTIVLKQAFQPLLYFISCANNDCTSTQRGCTNVQLCIKLLQEMQGLRHFINMHTWPVFLLGLTKFSRTTCVMRLRE